MRQIPQGKFAASFSVPPCVRYNEVMPRVTRTRRIGLMVTDDAKELAVTIAAAMTTDKAKWTETDAWEQGVFALARRPDVREALRTHCLERPTDEPAEQAAAGDG